MPGQMKNYRSWGRRGVGRRPITDELAWCVPLYLQMAENKIRRGKGKKRGDGSELSEACKGLVGVSE